MAHPTTQHIFLAAVIVAAALPLQAARFAGVEVPPPPPAQPVTETHWGVEISDPFRFLENVKDPTVQAWMKGQAEATDAILARLPGRDLLLARLKEIDAQGAGVVGSLRRVAGGRLFYLKREAGENQLRLMYRDGPQGAEKLIVDPEVLRQSSGVPHAIMDFAPSPDGTRVAYAIQTGGGEIGVLHVVDVASGKALTAPIDRIRYSGVSWLDDGSGFFFSRLREGYDRLPASERFGDTGRHFLALGEKPVERRVFSVSHNPELKLPPYAQGSLSQVHGTRQALLSVALGVERNLHLYHADLAAAVAGTARWQPIARPEDRISRASAAGGYLYLRSAKDAPRYRVLRVPVDDPDLSKAVEVMAESEGVITDISAAREALYITRRDGVVETLWRVPHTAEVRLHRVALPVEGAVTLGTSPRLNGALLTLSSWTRAARPWTFDPESGEVTRLPLVRDGKFDAPEGIVAREVRIKSHDGVEVPLSIIARKDLARNGTHPTILYGYGAYGTVQEPIFTPNLLAWLERGGVYAVAHVRGGGALGDGWHQAGRKRTKPNTWKDGIAAAEWLIANGYTARSRLGIYGGSAGGIFVGRAITERPDLFAAAVPMVGSLDSLRLEARANGIANVPEYGTLKKEDEFHGLREMSTYAAIRDGTRYPGVMLGHGVNDIRVDVWQSLKTAARFAAATASGKPILLRLEYDSGHGQGSTREQSLKRSADVWSFFLWQFGEAGFAPK
jgi:prolyl oligopeptidase